MDGEKDFGNDNPIAGIEKPRSSKKIWLFGGLGCLGMIGLICIGVVALGYFYGLKPMQEFQEQNVDLAIKAPEVEDALGAPVSAGKVVPTPDGSQKFTFKTPLKGSKAEGTLIFEGKLIGTEWVRESIYLDVNGEKIDLDPEAIFNLDIDTGF